MVEKACKDQVRPTNEDDEDLRTIGESVVNAVEGRKDQRDQDDLRLRL